MTRAFQGTSRSRKPSLERELTFWTFGLIAAAFAVFSAAAYRTGMHEADELLDSHLASSGELMALGGWPSMQDAASSLPSVQGSAHGHFERSLSVIVRNETGKPVWRIGPASVGSRNVVDGFSTMDLGSDSGVWRVFSRERQDGSGQTLSVLVSLDERDDLARDIALGTVLPALWLLPALGLAIALAVRRVLRPLRGLGEGVRALEGRATVAARFPGQRELQPIVAAVKSMSARHLATIERERQLADTLAHELRTPLTSLQLHASALKGDLEPADREAAIAQLDRDAKRASDTVAALVSLARGSEQPWKPAEDVVDLASLARDVVARHASAASRSQHSLTLVVPERCLVRGHAVLLDLAIANLVTNALGHTPFGTAVEVHVLEQPPMVQVRDNGASRRTIASSGIDLMGLGVGHRIAERVAQAHDGHFMPNGPDAFGWRSYTITLSRLTQAMAQVPAEIT